MRREMKFILSACPSCPSYFLGAECRGSRRGSLKTDMRPRSNPSGQHFPQGSQIDAVQAVDVGHADVFIDLVDGGVDDSQLHHLGAQRRDETAIGGAATGREFG